MQVGGRGVGDNIERDQVFVALAFGWFNSRRLGRRFFGLSARRAGRLLFRPRLSLLLDELSNGGISSARL